MKKKLLKLLVEDRDFIFWSVELGRKAKKGRLKFILMGESS